MQLINITSTVSDADDKHNKYCLVMQIINITSTVSDAYDKHNKYCK